MEEGGGMQRQKEERAKTEDEGRGEYKEREIMEEEGGRKRWRKKAVMMVQERRGMWRGEEKVKSGGKGEEEGKWKRERAEKRMEDCKRWRKEEDG